MKKTLAICLFTIQLMASLEFDVQLINGEMKLINFEEDRVNVEQILRRVYPHEHHECALDGDMYRLRYDKKILRSDMDFTTDGSDKPLKVDVIFVKEHFWELEFKLLNGVTVQMDVYNPKSERIPVGTLLTKLHYDPSRYRLYQSESVTEDFIERTDGNKFSVRRVTRKPHGPEYPVSVAMVGKDNARIDIKSKGTSADLLEEFGIYEPEKYKVEFQGRVIESDEVLSEFGVGAGATVTVKYLLGASTISAGICLRSEGQTRMDKLKGYHTPHDLMKLECDAENHEIWLNGKQLKGVKYVGGKIKYEMEWQGNYFGMSDLYQIERIIGKHLVSDNNDDMWQCLNHFR